MAVATLTDDVLGEHKIETGVGRITELDRRDRNIGVKIAAEGLRQPVGGWVDVIAHPEAGAIAGAAHAEGRAVRYRIVVRRKEHVDRARPFADLKIDEKVRDLVGLEYATAQTTESAPSGPPPPESAPQTAPAADDTGEPSTALTSGDRPRPRVQEARPWEPFNTDGTVNAGSYAFQAAVTLVDVAHRLILDHNRAETAALDQPDAVPLPPSPARVKSLAGHLLAVVDGVQRTMRADGKVDRLDNSHARARAVTVTALAAFPPPFATAGDADTVTEWKTALTAHAAALAAAAHAHTADYLGPWEGHQ